MPKPMAKRRFNWKKFGRDVAKLQEKVGPGLREAADRLDIHHATFCRAVHGNPIAVPDFAFLCSQAKMNPADYLYSSR